MSNNLFNWNTKISQTSTGYGVTDSNNNNSYAKYNINKKQIWLSGMHRAWNMINSDNPIGGLEIVQKSVSWSREEAQQWYNENIRSSDDGPIETRFEILDLRPFDE